MWSGKFLYKVNIISSVAKQHSRNIVWLKRMNKAKLTVPLGNFDAKSSIIDLGGPKIVPIEDIPLSNEI